MGRIEFDYWAATEVALCCGGTKWPVPPLHFRRAIVHHRGAAGATGPPSYRYPEGPAKGTSFGTYNSWEIR